MRTSTHDSRYKQQLNRTGEDEKSDLEPPLVAMEGGSAAIQHLSVGIGDSKPVAASVPTQEAEQELENQSATDEFDVVSEVRMSLLRLRNRPMSLALDESDQNPHISDRPVPTQPRGSPPVQMPGKVCKNSPALAADECFPEGGERNIAAVPELGSAVVSGIRLVQVARSDGALSTGGTGPPTAQFRMCRLPQMQE